MILQRRITNLVLSALVLLSVIALFYIKNKVIEQRKHLNWLSSQLTQENSNIQILKSELTYLSRPKRIYSLQKKYLNLQPITKEQIVKFDE